MCSPTIVRYRAERPGPGWHAHGTTSKLVWVSDATRLQLLLLIKQRWLHVETGATRHDRPVWDIPGSPYGLDLVFVMLYVWMTTPTDLPTMSSPQEPQRPVTRTLKRWLARFSPDAPRWVHAIRQELISRVAPRPLEDLIPAGGIPPPADRWRKPLPKRSEWLRDGGWLTKEVAPLLPMTGCSLLVEARRRWPMEPTCCD